MRASLIIALLAAGVSAQSPPPRPQFAEFEVASIKPTPPGPAGRWIRMLSANTFAAKNHTLKTLIAAAYNLNPRAILGGPVWIDTEHYDIDARTPGDLRPNLNEQMAMLRKLLADRFQLGIHREQKEMQAYAMSIAKTGEKLKESTVSPDNTPEGPPPLIFVVGPELVRLPGRYTTIGEFASVLQRAALEYPVVDRTGLSGRYDFDLEFTPDETVFGGVLGKGPDNPTKPALFAAIQEQLGLRLEPTKTAVDVVVVERAQRPSAN